MGTAKSIFEEDSVFVVGSNGSGQLCTRDRKDVKSLKLINNNAKIKAINNGSWFTIITTYNDKCFGVGFNKYGQLGLGHCDDSVLTLTEIKHFKENNGKSRDLRKLGFQQLFSIDRLKKENQPYPPRQLPE